jgi:hypothetical protein
MRRAWNVVSQGMMRTIVVGSPAGVFSCDRVFSNLRARRSRGG